MGCIQTQKYEQRPKAAAGRRIKQLEGPVQAAPGSCLPLANFLDQQTSKELTIEKISCNRICHEHVWRKELVHLALFPLRQKV